MKQSMGDLQKHIFEIGDKVDGFQTKLAQYFAEMAEFDRREVGAFFLDQRFYIISNSS